MKPGSMRNTLLALKITGKMKTINAILANWKTSIAGLAVLGSGLTALAVAIEDGLQLADAEPIALAVGLIAGGVAAILGRDADKSSEDSGAK